MKRPLLVTIVMVLQFLLGVMLAGLTIYLLALTRSNETLSSPDASDEVRGLMIGAVVLGIPAVVTLVGVLGLWKERFWGWVLALATDIGVIAVFVYNMVDERKLDNDEFGVTAGFVVTAILLLLPKVRKFFWNSPATALPAR